MLKQPKSFVIVGLVLVGVPGGGCTSFAGVGRSSDSADTDDEGSSGTTENDTSGPSSVGPSTTAASAGGTGDEDTQGSPSTECGNGVAEMGEECDDGNLEDADGCTNDCVLPTCTDGQQGGDETGVDCGGPCPACGCAGRCGAGEACEDRSCLVPVSCAQILARVPAASSGAYPIDPDGDGPGEPFEVLCDFDAFGGGWTLIATTSDDGAATWVWSEHDAFTTDTTTFGSVDAPGSDFKSPALHSVEFSELYFVHQPSGTTAVYDVAARDDVLPAFSVFMQDFALPESWRLDSGFPMTAGTLSSGAGLCETRLYINAADTDGENTAHASGPGWRALNNSPNCVGNFDDPGVAGAWGGRAASPATESDSRGFGGPLGLNSGASAASANYLQMWIR